MKLVILTLATFIVLLALLSIWNRKALSVKISSDSLSMSKELKKEMSGTSIPGYVLEYAPLVFLDRADPYFPSDMATHLAHTHPTKDWKNITDAVQTLNLDNLHTLGDEGGKDVYLTSTVDLITLPPFLKGQKPDQKTLQTAGAISCVIIVVDKGSGIMDAFFMYFYTYNKGPAALGHEVGNHLGDWEHNMVRFKDGEPQAVWFSQHDYGEAYTYSTVQKIGNRPVAFSARGSHANYAIAKNHDLHEYRPLWDPTLSANYYTFSTSDSKFTPAIKDTPVNYLYFEGMWGDAERPADMEGQENFHGFKKWTGGPRGPLDKHLDRKDVCLPNRPTCEIKTSL
ncbi:related to VPS62 Vacuolar Protein Sorting [Phialocephala subalpina]|uniref:Related to VPS62 Vacuolar Protein Sorting n=1 Tax=Phialocephala subalpina TaxID=576137 RepID=A0A1L7XAR3_9HELO|nr:related to VPS62 Vacuolar Protein Sorting [Phialocephala subalpina]